MRETDVYTKVYDELYLAPSSTGVIREARCDTTDTGHTRLKGHFQIYSISRALA